MVKVSIIVPTYNVQEYLEECMDSIVRQTLKEIEIICVNDGSTDNSLEILKRYAENDSRVIIIDKHNEGYGVGMNIGIEKATGEYIGIVEPDDFVKLTMFEDLYSVAKEHDLDFVKADFYRFTQNSTSGNMDLRYNRLDASQEYYNQILKPYDTPEVTKFIMNTWSGIYRRSFLEKHQIKHNTTPGASFQDNGFFWQTFMYAKRCMFIDKPYYMNRRDNPNSSVNSREKVYCMNIEYDHIREIFMRPENKMLWERFKAYYNFKRFHNYLFTLGRIGSEFKKEYVQRISREFKRAIDLEELDFTVFGINDKIKLDLLVKNPDSFYRKYAHRMNSADNSTKTKIKRKIRIMLSYCKRTLIKILRPAYHKCKQLLKQN